MEVSGGGAKGWPSLAEQSDRPSSISHARVKYKKQASKDTRKSKHISCVDCPAFDEDLGDDAMDDEPPAPHQHGTRFQKGRRETNAEEIAYKAEKVAALKSRFFAAVNVLEAATSREDVDTFFTIIDTGVFDITRKLPALPARTVTTVAKRPAAEPKRKASSRQCLLHKKKRQEEAAPKALVARRTASGKSKTDSIPISSSGASCTSASGASGDAGSADADSSFEEGFFHGPSCSETDSQTSYSSGAFR